MTDEKFGAYGVIPNVFLMNGKGPYGHPMSQSYETFNVTKGTYVIRGSSKMFA